MLPNSQVIFIKLLVVQLKMTDIVSTIEEEIYFYWETGLGCSGSGHRPIRLATELSYKNY